MNNRDPKDVGLGYTNSFTDKHGNEQRYIKLVVKQAIPANTELVVFANTNKKSPKHPDFSVKLSSGKKKSAAPQAEEKKSGGFPF